MLKHETLRRALTDAVPTLHANPDALRISLTNGSIAATLAASLSFEKRFTLRLTVTNLAEDIDVLLAPVLAWLRENQPDVMTDDASRSKGFTFAADFNSDGSLSVTIDLLLTERTLVEEKEDGLHVLSIAEPPVPKPVTRPVALYVHGELISRWDE
ncbi:phage tail protein [Erwinia oleae]|uniref:phage tail protein n=1 Tax=Erwinia oleae TaxID=796334 RepID=UPI000552D9FA|nr:phage tail protein [Erwinia oleae]